MEQKIGIRRQKFFRQKTTPVKEFSEKISFSALKKMVTTKEQEEILKKIEHETIPPVRDAWIEYFLEKTKHLKNKID